MVKIKLVLDSNEYVFYFDNKTEDMQRLLALNNVEIFLNDLIFREVIRNLRKDLVIDFINLIKSPKFNVSWDNIPEEVIEKYKKLELKKGDIIIASFCDSIGADCLISENRHFLKSNEIRSFKIVNLKKFLERVK
ncbi:PIN domain-containing protein [Candidatus Woesearchaeota archaeon]|nr:PIN domain-containing protein [Candidatus Woesearchaeota archaeon]